MVDIEERIMKDIKTFEQNIKKTDKEKLDAGQKKIVELAEMYARDSESFMKKKEYHTAFASIAYAHGLLDAVSRLSKKR